MIQSRSTNFRKQLLADICEDHAIRSHVLFEVVCIC